MSNRSTFTIDDMPVSVWCSPDTADLPRDTANVVSYEIWEKFGLDRPEVHLETRNYAEDWMVDNAVPENTWKRAVQEKPERLVEMVLDTGSIDVVRKNHKRIFHEWCTYCATNNRAQHDCMWAGLCISNAHDKTQPAQDNCSQVQKTVTAGQSLLISRHVAKRPAAKLDSDGDGDSSRPETPLGSDSYTMSDDESSSYLSWNERESISECVVGIMRLVPVGQVTGQMRRCRVEDQVQSEVHRETNIRNTLSDHSYYQPTGKELESLGLQTPSETDEEEIDVVTYERPVHQDAADQRQQLMMNAAVKKVKPPGTKPRGRPKKNAEDPAKKKTTGKPPPAKKPRYEPYTTAKTARTGSSPTSKRTTSTTTTTRRGASSPSSSSVTSATSRSSSSDEDIDEGKRTQHNNSERTRRIELRESFTELRLLVPAVMNNEKAAKVAILRRAAEYCDALFQQEESCQQKLYSLKKVQVALRMRLGFLRRRLARSR